MTYCILLRQYFPLIFVTDFTFFQTNKRGIVSIYTSKRLFVCITPGSLRKSLQRRCINCRYILFHTSANIRIIRYLCRIH